MRRPRPQGWRPTARPVVGVLLALSLGLATVLTVVPVAAGDPSSPGPDARGKAFPSKEQVDRAKARAASAARDVGAIKAQLLLAQQRLEQAGLQAEQASEAYNGAMWKLQQATERLRGARADAARARRTVATQRDRIGALVAQSYQQGGDLTALNAMMSADGPEGVLDQYVAFQGASSSLQADYQRFAASDSLAQVFERTAETPAPSRSAWLRRLEPPSSGGRRRRGGPERGGGRRGAEAAADPRLATAQHVSVALATQRQNALEEIARRRAEARARREAAAQARAAAAAQAAADAARAAAKKRPRPAGWRRRVRAVAPAVRLGNGASPGATAGAAPAPAPAPAPTPPRRRAAVPSRRSGSRRPSSASPTSGAPTVRGRGTAPA